MQGHAGARRRTLQNLHTEGARHSSVDRPRFAHMQSLHHDGHGPCWGRRPERLGQVRQPAPPLQRQSFACVRSEVRQSAGRPQRCGPCHAPHRRGRLALRRGCLLPTATILGVMKHNFNLTDESLTNNDIKLFLGALADDADKIQIEELIDALDFERELFIPRELMKPRERSKGSRKARSREPNKGGVAVSDAKASLNLNFAQTLPIA
mmetsp:Transcript_120511/g.340951  ORF Transcript_120511/g.340951 Transcript_120511/m.340951 type:complete len:208 (+) Transcript_120511:705-1328(+)